MTIQPQHIGPQGTSSQQSQTFQQPPNSQQGQNSLHSQGTMFVPNSGGQPPNLNLSIPKSTNQIIPKPSLSLALIQKVMDLAVGNLGKSLTQYNEKSDDLYEFNINRLDHYFKKFNDAYENLINQKVVTKQEYESFKLRKLLFTDGVNMLMEKIDAQLTITRKGFTEGMSWMKEVNTERQSLYTNALKNQKEEMKLKQDDENHQLKVAKEVYDTRLKYWVEQQNQGRLNNDQQIKAFETNWKVWRANETTHRENRQQSLDHQFRSWELTLDDAFRNLKEKNTDKRETRKIKRDETNDQFKHEEVMDDQGKKHTSTTYTNKTDRDAKKGEVKNEGKKTELKYEQKGKETEAKVEIEKERTKKESIQAGIQAGTERWYRLVGQKSGKT